MRPESAGLVVNPTAGRGAKRNLAIARQVMEALAPNRILTGPGQLGEAAAPEAEILSIADRAGRAATQWIAREAARAGIDALVVIGGDGTMADVAFALMEAGSRCPILGVGVGSTNVGELVTCSAADIAQLANCQFAAEGVDALVAGCNGQDLALAFNDVVIGTTIVGTLNARVCDLDASEHLAGKRVVGRPRPVGTATALVTKTSRRGVVEVAGGFAVGTVIVGFAHSRRFYGKAIVGGVCLTAAVGWPAGCLVCEQPLVRMDLDPDGLLAAEPIRSAYVSLTEADTIHVTGVGAPAVLCADGNPLRRLETEDKVQIGVRPNAVDVLRPV